MLSTKDDRSSTFPTEPAALRHKGTQFWGLQLMYSRDLGPHRNLCTERPTVLTEYVCLLNASYVQGRKSCADRQLM